jgi:hypothetical protein
VVLVALARATRVTVIEAVALTLGEPLNRQPPNIPAEISMKLSFPPSSGRIATSLQRQVCTNMTHNGDKFTSCTLWDIQPTHHGRTREECFQSACHVREFDERHELRCAVEAD